MKEVLLSELRSGMKVEVDVLGSPSIIVLMIIVLMVIVLMIIVLMTIVLMTIVLMTI